MRGVLLLVTVALSAPVAAACGPSFQATYECDVRFEHCYALDETTASTAVKKRCWHDWLAGYTFGQSRDRVEFASSRVRALSAPVDPGDNPPASSAARAAAPLPTTAFAPPPPVASAEASAAASASPPPARDAGLRAPGAACTDGCEDRWASCREGCRGATCVHCDRSYRSCMHGCFRGGAGGAAL